MINGKSELGLKMQAVLHVIETTLARENRSPCQREIAEATGIPLATVRNHAKVLEEKHYLAVGRPVKRGPGSTLRYTVLIPASRAERKTVEAFLRAAPAEPSRCPAEDLPRMVRDLYNSPAPPSIQTIATKTGWSRFKIQRVLAVLAESNEVTLRPQGTHPPRPVRQPDQTVVRRVVNLYNSREQPSIQTVAKKTGLSIPKVRKILGTSDEVTIHPPRGRRPAPPPDEGVVRQVVNLYNSREQPSIQTVAKKTHLTSHKVRKILRSPTK